MFDELQSVAESLALRLNRAVAIDDPQLRLLAHTAHDDRVDSHRIHSVMRLRSTEEVIRHAFEHGIATAVGPVRIPALPELGLLGRVCVPVRCLDILLGYLWLIDDDEDLGPDELEEAVQAACAAGEALLRRRVLSDTHREHQRELLRSLLGQDPSARAGASRALVSEGYLPHDGEVAVAIAGHQNEDFLLEGAGVDIAVVTAHQRVAPHYAPLEILSLGSGVFVVAGRPRLDVTKLISFCADLHKDLCHFLGGTRPLHVALGSVVDSVQLAHDSFHQARATLRVGFSVGHFPEVLSWDAIGVYQLLAEVPVESLRRGTIADKLNQLHHKDPILYETLETYLDHSGDVRSTIAELCIHRTSLYYRLNKIEEITGLSLSDGEHRLMLHLGTKIGHLTRSFESGAMVTGPGRS